MEISNCGLICKECGFYQQQCGGCYKVGGKTFWAQELPDKICSLFDCSIKKKQLKNCGDCDDLPCKMFVELKDPNISEEEHKKMMEKRVRKLKAEG